MNIHTVELGRTKLGDVATPLARRDHRKSKFGLRHDIKLNWLYANCHDGVRILIFDRMAEN